MAAGSLRADPGPPPHSRQSHVWEQKVGGASPEEPLAPEVSTPFPPLPPEPGGSGEVMAIGLEESQATPKEEPGPRPRINLRGVMRSISLLEPPSELESASGASDLPEVRLRLGGGPQGGGSRGKEQVAGGWRKTRQVSGRLSTLGGAPEYGGHTLGSSLRSLQSSCGDLVRADKRCLPWELRAGVGPGPSRGSSGVSPVCRPGFCVH